MARPRKDPSKVGITANALLLPDFLEKLDGEATKRRLTRSQFLAALIERGYAAYQRDGLLFEPEDDVIIEEVKPKKKRMND